MRQILDVGLKFLVFFIGWILFPDIFQFRDFKAVIVTTLLLIVVSILIMLIVAGFLLATDSEAMMVVAFIVALLLNAISIVLISVFYQGFHFGGGLKELALTSVALSVFTIAGKNDEN